MGGICLPDAGEVEVSVFSPMGCDSEYGTRPAAAMCSAIGADPLAQLDGKWTADAQSLQQAPGIGPSPPAKPRSEHARPAQPSRSAEVDVLPQEGAAFLGPDAGAEAERDAGADPGSLAH